MAGDPYQIGLKLGQAIRLLIEAIALIENVEPNQVLDEIVAHYVAQRIIDEANE